MRTTLDIPDELGRRVKMAAVRRGLTMKHLIVTAIEHELGARKQAPARNTISFPLIPSKKPGVYELKPEQINDILLREEIAAYEATDRR